MEFKMKIIFFIILIYSIGYSQTPLSENWLIFNRENSPLASHRISTVLSLENDYWILTNWDKPDSLYYPRTLYKYSGKDWMVFDSTNSPLTHDIVMDIAFDRNNNLLAATSKGLYIFDGTTWQIFDSQNSPLTSEIIYKITVDNMNNYWLGVEEGIVKYDGTWTFYNNQNSFYGIDDYNFIGADSSNNIWVGTDYYGLYYFDGSDWHMKLKGEFVIGGTFQPVVSFAIDKINNLWFALLKEGGGTGRILNLIDSTMIFYDSTEIGYDFNMFSYDGIVVDTNNVKWFGTSGGLLRFDGNEWDMLNTSNSPIPSNWFGSGYVDKRNNKIFGLASFPNITNRGLIFYNEDSVTVTSVRNDVFNPPSSFRLYQNYPNPFNPSTTINYSLSSTAHIKLIVYNIIGEKITILKDEIIEAGYHTVTWAPSNVPSGIYFFTLYGGNNTQTKKMILIK
jgi:hypothetical protein